MPLSTSGMKLSTQLFLRGGTKEVYCLHDISFASANPTIKVALVDFGLSQKMAIFNFMVVSHGILR